MQLQSIEQKATNKYRHQVGITLLAAVLSAMTIGWIMSAFSITWGEGGLLGGGLSGGMIRVWNSIAGALGNSDYILLNQYKGAGNGSGLFLILVGLVLALVGYAALRSRKIWLLLLYVIPFFAVQMLWHIQPFALTGLLFLCAVLAAVFYCLHSGPGTLTAIVLLVCVAGIAVGGFWLLTGDRYDRPKLVDEINQKVSQGIETARYGSNSRGDGNLKPKGFGAEDTALEIKMEQPNSLYLRGFVGSVYQDGVWTSLDASDYYSQKGLFYWLHKDGFSGLTQLRADSDLIGENRDSNRIAVTNKNANRKYIYVPYELDGADLTDTKNWSDSFLTAEPVRGTENYSFQAVKNMVKDWPALTAKLFTQKKSAELEQYRIDESYYNVQVYKDYASLTTEEKNWIAHYMGSAGDQKKGHVDYKESIKRIRGYLEAKFIYTEHVKLSDDPVQDFFKTKKGCDVHYASAATLMFRYYGIPARYVEGYIVTPKDVKGKASGQSIAVPASNNHAWTEIYIDSFGWVPLEVTPEYYDKMQQPDMSKGLESKSQADAFNNQVKQKAKQIKETEASDNDQDKEFSWKWILLMLAIDLLLVLLLYACIRLIQSLIERRRRNRAFHDENVKMAICAIYGYMLKLGIKPDEKTLYVGDRAAYSPYSMEEEDRQFMLAELERMKRENHEKKNHGRSINHVVTTVRRRMRRPIERKRS